RNLSCQAVDDQGDTSPSEMEFPNPPGTSVSARLDARNKLGWTPLMVSQGMLIAANGRWKPRAEALIRQLMTERGLDPALYSQRQRSSTIVAAPQSRCCADGPREAGPHLVVRYVGAGFLAGANWCPVRRGRLFRRRKRVSGT